MIGSMYCLGQANKMESWKVNLFVLSVVLVIGAKSVLGIQCFVCNSGYKYAGETCLNKDLLEANRDTYLKDCADEEVKDNMPNGTYKYCRTFGQTVLEEYRLIRQCASGGKVNKCIERTGIKDIKLSYCHCDVDACNSANTMVTTVTLLLTAVTGVWMMVQRT